jgi:hypothetical protein
MLLRLLAVAIAFVSVAACKKSSDAGFESKAAHGRYAGVGIYTPGAPWTKLLAAETANPAGARPIDDQAIIVVIDSQTGEVRACGDLSGTCVGMNPWKSAMAASRVAPVALTEHAKPADDAPANTAGVGSAGSR